MEGVSASRLSTSTDRQGHQRFKECPKERPILDDVIATRFTMQEVLSRSFEQSDGKRRISADTALRLARYFGTSERFWINLQSRYDLEIERDNLGSKLEAITPLAVA